MTKLIIQRQRREAQYYTENLGEGISLDMILLPSGSFQMGTPDMEIEKLCKEYDVEYFQRESPQHRVNISSFFMGRYPITQAQWKAIASTAKIDIELKPEPSHFKDPYQEQDRWTRPIEQVSWYDAVEFCKRLSRETKREYRLPSEAEWEYACRAGTTTAFHFGETIITDLANYRGTDWEGCTICTETFGNGAKTIIIITMKAHPLMGVLGLARARMIQRYYVAALGSSIRVIAVPRIATTTSRASAAIFAVFVWCVLRPGLFSPLHSSPFA